MAVGVVGAGGGTLLRCCQADREVTGHIPQVATSKVDIVPGWEAIDAVVPVGDAVCRGGFRRASTPRLRLDAARG